MKGEKERSSFQIVSFTELDRAAQRLDSAVYALLTDAFGFGRIDLVRQHVHIV